MQIVNVNKSKKRVVKCIKLILTPLLIQIKSNVCTYERNQWREQRQIKFEKIEKYQKEVRSRSGDFFKWI